VQTDSNVLVTLLAVRLLGGQSVPAADPLLKSLKPGVKEAVEKNFLQQGKVKVPTMNKAGKTTNKNVDVIQLTEAGERYLREAADPEALAATRAGELVTLRKNLEVDRKQFQDEVKAALKPQGKASGEGKIQTELSALSKKVDALAQQLEKLEKAAEGGGDSAILNKLDQAFSSMLARLDKTLQAQPASPVTARPAPPTAPADSLATVLHKAYDKLRLFIEFRDGLVELPRLYHEARKSLPDLTVKAFHDELMALWDRREAELHILNEEYKAAEPDKGIRHNDKLYYYLMWKRT
jgi:hypothetical protein